MPVQQLVFLLIVFASTTLYATRWLPFEATSILIIASLALTGVLPPEQALAGFSSTATLTVAAMFVLSGGLMRTGALEAVTLYLARFSNGDARRLLLLLAVTVPVASAFVNNTPVVVLMVPVVLSLSRQFNIRPSKLLIPVSYFSMLGGTVTLLGTSTNILLDDLYRKAGGPGLGFFEFTPLGLIYIVVGGLFLYFFSERLLPNRSSLSGLVGDQEPSTYISEIVVGPTSDLAGKTVEQTFDRIATNDRLPAAAKSVQHHRRLRRTSPAGATSRATTNTPELLEVLRDGTIFRGRNPFSAPTN